MLPNDRKFGHITKKGSIYMRAQQANNLLMCLNQIFPQKG
jgi:hypothetical protein